MSRTLLVGIAIATALFGAVILVGATWADDAPAGPSQMNTVVNADDPTGSSGHGGW